VCDTGCDAGSDTGGGEGCGAGGDVERRGKRCGTINRNFNKHPYMQCSEGGNPLQHVVVVDGAIVVHHRVYIHMHTNNVSRLWWIPFVIDDVNA